MQSSEKLFRQWNDFQSNVKSAFADLRTDRDFADVTLVSEDGQQLFAHKVILASSSPFFMEIFIRNKHAHPLIYMRGISSEELTTIVDFLYFGEANLFQENLDAFLSLANELKLKGLESSSEDENSKYTKLPATRDLGHSELEGTLKGAYNIPIIADNSIFQSGKKPILERQVALTNSTAYANAEELNDQIKSMMTKIDQTSDSRGRGAVCNMCGKEGQWNGIRDHIEANRITGVSHSCNLCGKMSKTRVGLRQHVIQHHR